MYKHGFCVIFLWPFSRSFFFFFKFLIPIFLIVNSDHCLPFSCDFLPLFLNFHVSTLVVGLFLMFIFLLLRFPNILCWIYIGSYNLRFWVVTAFTVPCLIQLHYCSMPVLLGFGNSSIIIRPSISILLCFYNFPLHFSDSRHFFLFNHFLSLKKIFIFIILKISVLVTTLQLYTRVSEYILQKSLSAFSWNH